MKGLTQFLRDLGPCVSYYPGLAPVLGGASSAILFCQLFWWTEEGEDDAWVDVKPEKLKRHTGLSDHELAVSRQKLSELGIIEAIKTNSPPRYKYKIDFDRLDEVWETKEEIIASRIESNCRRTQKACEALKKKREDAGENDQSQFNVARENESTSDEELNPRETLHQKHVARKNHPINIKTKEKKNKKTSSSAGAGAGEKSASNSSHPMVKMYRNLTGFNQLNKVQIDRIAGEVEDEEKWQLVIEARALRGYFMGRVNNALDDYHQLMRGIPAEEIYPPSTKEHNNGKHHKDTDRPRYETRAERNERISRKNIEIEYGVTFDGNSQRGDQNEADPDGEGPVIDIEVERRLPARRD
ncbi:MAG: hypothetical protein MOB07_24250 [Acidobacteria bacterium]|nr:hypothetical protein [Acidobacteriota bacterium]